MSAILGIFNFDQRPESDAVVQDMLAAMRSRGADQVQVWSAGGAVLAVARYAWESASDFAGASLVVEDGDCVLVADASVYYRDVLSRRLAAAGVAAPGSTAGELILAAYRAWGSRCAEEIDGDFAFIIWDRTRRQVVCARDHSGFRPLFYAEFGETLVLASTIGGVLGHPRCPQDLNLDSIALDALGLLFAYANATSFRAIEAHPAGATAVWTQSGRRQLDHWWDPKVATSPRSMEAAAEELRVILGDAVEQRLAANAPSALWLSGGWDSSSVFAMGMQRLRSAGRAETLRAVSMSYPEGDSGREDEMIQAIVGHWSAPIHWVDATGIPPIEVSEAYARRRDEASPFHFEKWMRYLARSTRATDARAVLTGHGGNFLFASSAVFLSDLLAAGQWRTLWREWRALKVQRGQRARHFFKWAVQPLLPATVQALLEKARGKPLLGTYERPLPAWLKPEFAARHGIFERARTATPVAPGGSRSDYELYWFMTHPVFARINAQAFEATLMEGIEQRAPLYDPRLIRFTAAGSWSERFSRAGTKRLLRYAMRGFLPDVVLADRFGRRDGTLGTYVEQSLKSLLPSMYHFLEQPIVAELGIVDPVALKRDLDRYAKGGGNIYLPEQLLSVAHVESWFREREKVGPVVPTAESTPQLV